MQLLSPSEIALRSLDGTALGPGTRFRKARLQHVDRVEKAQCFKRSEVRNHYNELTLPSRDFDLVVRVYNDGAAYRFVLHRAFTLSGETAQFCFPEDARAWIPYAKPDAGFDDPMFNSFENIYVHTPLRAWEKGRLAFLPITVDGPQGMKLCITEADLFNYPGMFLRGADGELEGVFARYPRDIEQGAHNNSSGR